MEETQNEELKGKLKVNVNVCVHNRNGLECDKREFSSQRTQAAHSLHHFFAVYDFYFDLKHRNCYRYLISTIQYGQKFI